MKNIDVKSIDWRKVFSLRNAMVVFLGASLYAQLDHTAYVVEHLARKSASGSHAYALALAVEFSVLLFVLAGHKRISWAFAVATFLTNLSFYWIQLGGAWFSPEAPMAVLMALLLPGVIIGYSHSVAQHSAPTTAAAQDEAQHDEPAAQPAPATQDDVQLEDVELDVTTMGDAETKTLRTTVAKPAQKMSAEQRRMHIKESGVTDAAQIAAQYGISKRQAQQDLRKIREDDAELHDPQVVLREVRAQVVQANGTAH